MAKIKSWNTPIKNFTQSIKWCWFKLVVPCLRVICRIVNRLRKTIARNARFALVFLLTIILIIGLLFFCILPTSQNFEGNLLVSSLSFTANESDRLLLKDVNNLQEITISGIQKFTLSGKFLANPKLENLQQLEIELPYDNSQLTITPTAEFSLKELRLQEKNSIKNLKYDTYNRRLSLIIKPSDTSLTPVFIFNPSSAPLKITLSGYKIPKLSLSSDETPLEFSLQTTEFELQPTTTIDVNLTLSQDKQPVFWGNIDVSNVKFEKVIQAGDNINDDLLESTILSGDIRMAKQELKLEEKQFLIIEPPGIETINRIQIIQPDPSQTLELKTTKGDKIKLYEPPKGLEVSVSGNSNSIKIGLNQKLAIAQIQGSFLSRYVSNDVLVAIISLTVGSIASLIVWLFKNFSNSFKSKNEKK